MAATLIPLAAMCASALSTFGWGDRLTVDSHSVHSSSCAGAGCEQPAGLSECSESQSNNLNSVRGPCDLFMSPISLSRSAPGSKCDEIAVNPLARSYECSFSTVPPRSNKTAFGRAVLIFVLVVLVFNGLNGSAITGSARLDALCLLSQTVHPRLNEGRIAQPSYRLIMRLPRLRGCLQPLSIPLA